MTRLSAPNYVTKLKPFLKQGEANLNFWTLSSKITRVRHVPSPSAHSSDRSLGTVHGFAARPALEIPESVAGFEGALEQSIAWFKKYLA